MSTTPRTLNENIHSLEIKAANVTHGLLILTKITTKGSPPPKKKTNSVALFNSPLIPRAQVISTPQLSERLAQARLRYSAEGICEMTADFTDMLSS